MHQATISAAVLDSAGNLVMEAIVETKAETILQFLRGLRGSLLERLIQNRWFTAFISSGEGSVLPALWFEGEYP